MRNYTELTTLDRLLKEIAFLRDAKELLDILLDNYDVAIGAFTFPTDKQWEKQVKKYRSLGANGDLRKPTEKLQERIEKYMWSDLSDE